VIIFELNDLLQQASTLKDVIIKKAIDVKDATPLEQPLYLVNKKNE